MHSVHLFYYITVLKNIIPCCLFFSCLYISGPGVFHQSWVSQRVIIDCHVQENHVLVSEVVTIDK